MQTHSDARSPVRVRSAALSGLNAFLVHMDVTPGADGIHIRGLPRHAAREVAARVCASLATLGIHQGATVDLQPPLTSATPAALALPIAVGILAARGSDSSWLASTVIAGELNFSGDIQPFRGALAVAEAAKAVGCAVLVPSGNAREATLAGIHAIAAHHLHDVLDYLDGVPFVTCAAGNKSAAFAPDACGTLDFSDVPGQEDVKSALELAAAGDHPVALVGPAGAGHTLLARRMTSILPPPTPAEQLEVTRIYSATGVLLAKAPLVTARPFRAPHHTVSEAGLVGGGAQARPGEVTLAHRGVLFLDELPEFRRTVLATLWYSLERRAVELAGGGIHLRFPCDVQLLASLMPCPCGHRFMGGCTCAPSRLASFRERALGLLRHFHLLVPTRPGALASGSPAEPARPSLHFRERVVRARERQAARGQHGLNAHLHTPALLTYCTTAPAARRLLQQLPRDVPDYVQEQLLALARTKADLEGHANIEEADMETARRYVPFFAGASVLAG